MIVDQGDGWTVEKVKPSSNLDTSLWDELLNTDLEGGTLVEYKEGMGFDQEWGRATILQVTREGRDHKTVHFKTDGEAHLILTVIKDDPFGEPPKVDKKRGIYYLDIPHMYCYAIAPKGIKILMPGEAITTMKALADSLNYFIEFEKVRKARSVCHELQEKLNETSGSTIPSVSLEIQAGSFSISIGHFCVWSTEVNDKDELTVQFCLDTFENELKDCLEAVHPNG